MTKVEILPKRKLPPGPWLTRVDGFYWVRFDPDDPRLVAQWSRNEASSVRHYGHDPGAWWICGDDAPYRESDFSEIDERRIVREPKDENDE